MWPALSCGAALNLSAVTVLVTIVIDGPYWLVITLTIITTTLALTTGYALRRLHTIATPEIEQVSPHQ